MLRGRGGGAGRRRNRPWEGEGGGPPEDGAPGAPPGAPPGGMPGMGGLPGFANLFDPSAMAERRQAAARMRQAVKAVTNMALVHVPDEMRDDCQVVVFDACGCQDVDCEPAGTVIQFIFRSGVSGSTVSPKAVFDITEEDVAAVVPPLEVIQRWRAGEEVEWPPRPKPVEPPLPTPETHPLRFEKGTRVRCRVGPDPVTGWRKGTIVKHYYREARWPPGKWVPYQIELDGGTFIYAPKDVDRLVQKVEDEE
uniref:Uncharacterized protein n=1 Tax=Phaeomonas parva TaxID=124430 RepID=A0A6U4D1R8_9STRA|mmetsp:Transcript_14205/g.42534  ORF Transcript_14205/g.42534 Transcript_14205/m.42534 type:complete len:251 (+) Transcript_14205:179-931(+)|eukprot:CAMPEP_0118870816 /NCGR_PEP_ID=MMETSP1163-20130328/13636_1 /TAXON_ID=124430 /ORGANISM="Phaeomonas parva, Strain CCMP2877" /LENGTH=250 /DNA_ID=CAMNT_0006805857 /DNA_START=169 /DNA_END=921 /DNA_ORIENTATION=-